MGAYMPLVKGIGVECPAWTKDAYMRLSIFPNTYAEVILLLLCEININTFLSNGSKQMPRYNSCLPAADSRI